MCFTLFCAIIASLCFIGINAKYNKDVVCVIDNQDKFPVCTIIDKPRRRNAINSNEPSHDPYVPRSNAVFFNCSGTSHPCESITLTSLTQVTNPNLNLKCCYLHKPPAIYDCEKIRYTHFKNIDKLLFLNNNIQNKKFYAVDCLIYADKSRVCNAKDNSKGSKSHTELVDFGTLVRPKEQTVLSQEEFICEENEAKVIHCDIDPFIPFVDGLKLKESIQFKGDILLKTGTFAVILKKHCEDSWCGYTGKVAPTRRSDDWFKKYEPPGGKIFRCYYAKKQQICKMIDDSYRVLYNGRSVVDFN